MVDVYGANNIYQDFVLSVALTPDSQWVLSGSKDRGVQFWDPRTGDTQLMLQGHKNSGTFSVPEARQLEDEQQFHQMLISTFTTSYLCGPKPPGRTICYR